MALVAERRHATDKSASVRHSGQVRVAAHNANFSNSEAARAGLRNSRRRYRKAISAINCRSSCSGLLDDRKGVTALGAARENGINQVLTV